MLFVSATHWHKNSPGCQLLEKKEKKWKDIQQCQK